MEMKRWLSVTLALCMALSLAACGGGSSSSAPAGGETQEAPAGDQAGGAEAATEAAENGGGTIRDTLIVAANREPVSLDPTDVTVTYATLIDDQIYDGLLKFDNDLNVVGDLAESWEQVDDLTWKFNLRKGVKFHNGEELTSKDVLFSFKRVYDRPAAAVNVAYIDPDGFETPDDYTFILKTTVPYAFLESQMCHYSLFIMNEKAVTEGGDDYGRNPVGTGPYKFVSWAAGDNITLERNDEYWGEPALTKTIIFRMITENSSRTINLESGDIDMCIDIQDSDAERIAQGEDTVCVEGATGSVRYFGLNCRHEVFKDKRVRQAMAHATDVETIRQVVYGDTTSTPGKVTPVPPGYAGRNEDLTPYEYDVEKAKALLKEAGYENGFTVKYIYLASTVNNMTAEMLQSMWKEVGVTLELNPMESGALSTAMNNAEQDACCAGTNMDSFEAGKGLFDFFHSSSIGNTMNRTYLDSPEVDAMLEAISTEMDKTKRDEMVYEVQKLINEESPLIVICHTNAHVGMRKNVQGFVYTPTQRYDLTKVTVVD